MHSAMNLPAVLFLTLFVILRRIKSEPCTQYGCPGRPYIEPFIPAPPGHTPRCAKPGQTFCETPEHYPQQLIKFLVDKCSYDFSSALRNELNEDFNAPSIRPEHGYDYPKHEVPYIYSQPIPFLPPQNLYTSQPALVYGPPSNETYRHSPKYLSRSQRNPFLSEVPSTKTQQYFQSQRSTGYPRTQSIEPNWRGNRPSYSQRENPLLQYTNRKWTRTRRQSNTDSISICPTNPQYITPRAALNSEGNWMYVVNVQEQNNNQYSQVVRSETCATNKCNALCSIPDGYTSRCQQQYVQKRLIALDGTGNRLYTDIFWFPHGCSCQVMLEF